MTPLALGILGSGKGSNCRAILEQIRAGNLNAEVRLVVSDVLEAGILDIARGFEVPNAYLPPGKYRTKLEPQVEQDLVKMLRDAEVNLVVLAGFMRVLKAPMLDAFPRRIINIHPPISPGDTPPTLHERIQLAEYAFYPSVIAQFARGER